MKYKVTFIAPVEDRDHILQGGVSFVPGKPVTIDSDETEMSPWFEGNSSFHIEAIEHEATEDQDQHDDHSASSSATGGSEASAEDAEDRQAEVKPVAKRTRRKAVAK